MNHTLVFVLITMAIASFGFALDALMGCFVVSGISISFQFALMLYTIHNILNSILSLEIIILSVAIIQKSISYRSGLQVRSPRFCFVFFVPMAYKRG
jgi:hypothetical protein